MSSSGSRLFLPLSLCVVLQRLLSFFSFFFFNDTATTEIYTLSLHDALPIFDRAVRTGHDRVRLDADAAQRGHRMLGDRKSTRLNSSHSQISYAVFCLKKKKKNRKTTFQYKERQSTDGITEHTRP